MADATRLKYSTNSRPRKKHNISIRRTNVRLTIPVRKNLCKVKEITEVDTFNCALKCSEWRKMFCCCCCCKWSWSVKLLIRIFCILYFSDLYNNIPRMRVNKLRALENVEEIADYLRIDSNHTQLRNLKLFLPKLRAIYGRYKVYAPPPSFIWSRYTGWSKKADTREIVWVSAFWPPVYLHRRTNILLLCLIAQFQLVPAMPANDFWFSSFCNMDRWKQISDRFLPASKLHVYNR